MGDVVEFRRPPPPKPEKRLRAKSQYELYPMPFFDRAALCTWKVLPTGVYSDDCETGKAYALEFLNSCDGTVGWTTLLAQITRDMILVGPDTKFANGEPSTNGIVVGFMGTIGKALAAIASIALSNDAF